METRLSILLNDKGNTILSISPQHTIHECALKMKQFNIGALIVMENNHIEGIISERDIVWKLVVLGSDPMKTHVADIMVKEVSTVSPTTTVREAMQIVTEKRFRHLPVVEDGHLIGLISIGDLTRWAMISQEQQISSLTSYIQNGS